MYINYPIRSAFLAPCEDIIRKEKHALSDGQELSIHLTKGGYSKTVQVTISPADSISFSTGWEGTDPTRFPARIRAAAFALYRQGCFGSFEIDHNDGLLTIRSLDVKKVLYKRVASSQFTDGVRINQGFHNTFNPPSSDYYVSKGQSRSITISFNGNTFRAKYLYENPTNSDREKWSPVFGPRVKFIFQQLLNHAKLRSYEKTKTEAHFRV